MHAAPASTLAMRAFTARTRAASAGLVRQAVRPSAAARALSTQRRGVSGLQGCTWAGALSAPRAAPASLPPFAGVRGYAQLSIQEYHEAADETLEALLSSFEFLQEEVPDVDSDLAQGVLTIKVPSAGTYVINKQPPNQQIWLSSPVSGPKRYDLVEGRWVYARDNSTLGELLRTEVLESTKHPLDLQLA